MKMLFKVILKPHKATRLGYALVMGAQRLGLEPDKILKYLAEFYLNRKFWRQINKNIERAKREFQDPRLGGWMLGYPASLLYALMRLVQPDVVVETGVGPGGSSSIILLALHVNKRGRLISIDLPGADAQVYPKIGKLYNIHVPPGYEVGWLVPSWLRDRWDLRLGDSKELLPKVLDELGIADVFLHDSLHTDEHVLFELSTVFSHLRAGGLLLADDVNDYWSLGFIRFCEEKEIPYVVFRNRLGVARK
jgi:hypothetical protein